MEQTMVQHAENGHLVRDLAQRLDDGRNAVLMWGSRLCPGRADNEKREVASLEFCRLRAKLQDRSQPSSICSSLD